MKGFEVGERYDTMGLRGNDLRRLYFNDVQVPAENVLGEPGEGFHIAMHILNNGRLSLGTGSVGATKGLLDRVIEHTTERRQFDQPLADFELVQDKIAWMVSYLFGLESMAYLTCGMVDAGVAGLLAGVGDLQGLGDRVPLVRGQPGDAAEGRRRLHARRALREGAARHPHLPDLRGRQRRPARLHRANRHKPLGEQLSGLGELELTDPIGSLGVMVDYVSGRIKREVRPDRITLAHPEISKQADAVGEQVKRLRDVTEGQLREHRKEIVERQFQQKRLSDAVSDVFAQVALLSRVTSILEDQGVEVSGQEIYIADTFCTRAAGRVGVALDQIESNDDERMSAIAKLAPKRGSYGYALFED